MGVLWSIAGCGDTRRPTRFLLPDGYIGTIGIRYSVKGAPPLSREQGDWLARIPEHGVLETSTPFETGVATDRYFYCRNAVRRELGPDMVQDGHTDGVPMVDNHVLKGHSKDEEFNVIFVGTESQYARFENLNRVGPIDPKLSRQGQRFVSPHCPGRQLNGAKLAGSIFTGCNLSGAKLRGSDLRAAEVGRLDRADLRHADLREVDAFQEDFIGADLRGADLRGAWLQAANFKGARLDGADLHGAHYDGYTVWPHGFDPKKYAAVRVPDQPLSPAARI